MATENEQDVTGARLYFWEGHKVAVTNQENYVLDGNTGVILSERVLDLFVEGERDALEIEQLRAASEANTYWLRGVSNFEGYLQSQLFD